MIVRRVIEPLIAQCAYLVACPRTRQAVLIDPVRDVQRYETVAQEAGVTIMAVLETHAPSDYISGIREFLVSTAVTALLSGETSPPEWFAGSSGEWRARVKFLRDGDELTVGDLHCKAILTPGHAPGGLSIAISHEPSGVKVIATGDALLVGGAGRTSQEDSNILRDSLSRLTKLPDETIVLAGHTSGSSCGKAVNLPGESTLGVERRFNRVLRTVNDQSAFASVTCENQPDRPSYFARVEQVNVNECARLMYELSEPKELAGDTFLQFLSFPSTLVLDTRSWSDYITDAPDGALHAPVDKYFAPMVAGVIGPEERVVIICLPSAIEKVTTALRLVGVDRIDGWISAAEYRSIDRALLDFSEVDEIPQNAARALHGTGEALFLDVRTTAEWLKGRIDGAMHMSLSQLSEQLSRIPKGVFVVAYCVTGNRSSRACTFLQRRGVLCATLKGGFWPWFGRGYPVEAVDQPQATHPVTASVG